MMEDTCIPEDVIHGVVSPFAHGEVVNNPLLHNNKAFFAKLTKEFRRTVVLAADEEMTVALRESRHESFSPDEKDHIRREQEKFSLLAKAYKRKPGQRGGGVPCRGGGNDDDDDDDDDDGDNGSGGRGGGGQKLWSFTTLGGQEKKTLERYPPPTRSTWPPG